MAFHRDLQQINLANLEDSSEFRNKIMIDKFEKETSRQPGETQKKEHSEMLKKYWEEKRKNEILSSSSIAVLKGNKFPNKNIELVIRL